MTLSAVILSCNRHAELTRALNSCIMQDYPPCEIIVVDNASSEGLPERISKDFPSVRVIALDSNIGVAARNTGIRNAIGDIIVTIDDDIYFDDTGAFREIIAAFNRHPEAGCAAFRVYSTYTKEISKVDWCHPRAVEAAEYREFETSFITEGACAFRRKVFDTIDGYWSALFINMEGTDLSWRMFDVGWELWYAPTIKVWHSHASIKRPTSRAFYHNPRNLILIAYRTVPGPRMFQFLIPRLLLLAINAILKGQCRSYFRGVASAFVDIKRLGVRRQPVSTKALTKWSRLRSTMPPIQVRILRAWRNLGPRLAAED